MQAALAGSPLLMGLGGGCGGGAGMPAHASAAAAAAALLEAALQPGTPPGAGPHARLASSGSLARGLPHALAHAHGGDDMGGMGATMRLLAAGLSGQLPAGVAEQVQAGADVSAALAAIGTLSALVDKARAGVAGHELMQVLCGMLPALAMQAQQAAAAAAQQQQAQQLQMQHGFGHHHGHQHQLQQHHTHRHHQASMMGPIGVPVHGGSSLLTSYASAPVPAPLSTRVHRTSDGSTATGLGSPLSGPLTDRAPGSVSSHLSDGSHSPPLSHHSDDGLRCDSGSSHHSLYSSPSQRLAANNLDSCMSAPATARGERGSPSHSPLQHDARSLADRLPLSLHSRPGSNADLAGMVDMAGAPAMIASLSELVDGGQDAQLQSNGSGDRSHFHSLDAPLNALTLSSNGST
ncbi:hypothetical protein FOA52_001179 [Chlamydomonas sp. UWO 241]|nr:hypothetical protein FOA52_001179 [Chlamydomonas sp. UWO 241]